VQLIWIGEQPRFELDRFNAKINLKFYNTNLEGEFVPLNVKNLLLRVGVGLCID
jgi:hypothetical protein